MVAAPGAGASRAIVASVEAARRDTRARAAAPDDLRAAITRAAPRTPWHPRVRAAAPDDLRAAITRAAPRAP